MSGSFLRMIAGQVYRHRRINQDAWQFPQGGINPDETPEDALYRELNEEVGLERDDVEILACTRGWFALSFTPAPGAHPGQPLCIGQKQKWFLLRLVSNEQRSAHGPDWQTGIRRLALGQLLVSARPGVVTFKREVYRRPERASPAPADARLTTESHRLPYPSRACRRPRP